MNHRALLRTENIQFSYGTNYVLQQISLEVEEGEILGIVGPNGAGKTTLLSIMSGALKPRSGEVYLNGARLAELQPKERATTVAMVPQNPAIPQGFTALEMVLMGRNPHLGLLQWEGPKDLEICRQVMELTTTWNFGDRLISTLSGGERQRVFIARALAQEAPLLLLDEPTAHLDLGYQSGVLDMIDSIRKEAHVTVITAMHDLTLAAQYCDRMAALHQGTIFALGRPDEVLRPDVVSTTFGAEVSIIRHPVHGTPVVLPTSHVANSRPHMSYKPNRKTRP